MKPYNTFTVSLHIFARVGLREGVDVECGSLSPRLVCHDPAAHQMERQSPPDSRGSSNSSSPSSSSQISHQDAGNRPSSGRPVRQPDRIQGLLYPTQLDTLKSLRRFFILARSLSHHFELLETRKAPPLWIKPDSF